MNIFPRPKKMICKGEFINTKKGFKLARDDFNTAKLDYAISKLNFDNDGINLSFILNDKYKNEEYSLEFDNCYTNITASTPRGVFYAIMTLLQIVRSTDICCVEINDYPDFEDRGMMLDFSRGRVRTLKEMKKLVDKLAELKYNQLQMAFDAIVFEYKGLEKYYEDKKDAILTREYVKELKEHCKKNMIELVPNQNSFGHMHAWLAFDDFKDLAECPDGFYRTDEEEYTSLWEPGTLNPYDPRSLELVDRIYGGLLPSFDSGLMHCCCDETFDLSNGQGKSHAIVKKIGLTKVYTDYMNKLYKICQKYGKRMMFWADMIIGDVKALKDMPADAIAVIWGYEQEYPYDEYCRNAKNSGLDFYVAPGTCTWSSIVGRSDNMKYTQQSAAENGRKYGAKGYLLTDWSDNNNSPVTDEVPIAYGAGVAWGVDENSDLKNACTYLDENVFFEKGFAKFIYDCGNAYTLEAYKRFNTPVLCMALRTRLDFNYYMKGHLPQHFQSIIRFADEQILKLKEFKNCSLEYIEEIKINLEMIKTLSKVCIIKTGGEVDYKEIIAEFEDQSERLENMWIKTKCLNFSNGYKEETKKLIHHLKMPNYNNI